MKSKAGITKVPMPSPSIKKAKGFKKVINKVNKVNPATVAVRNGILASMKLNIKNVAGRLRWSYLSPQDAIKKGIDAFKFQRLIATRQKLENIFYKCGGKPENLRNGLCPASMIWRAGQHHISQGHLAGRSGQGAQPGVQPRLLRSIVIQQQARQHPGVDPDHGCGC